MPFRSLLRGLVDRTPGARGAVFCDFEGEFVDLAIKDAALTPYDLRAFGAHLAAPWLNLQSGSAATGAGGLRELKIGCAGGTLLCHALRDGYYLVLVLGRGHAVAAAAWEVRRCAEEVLLEL